MGGETDRQKEKERKRKKKRKRKRMRERERKREREREKEKERENDKEREVKKCGKGRREGRTHAFPLNTLFFFGIVLKMNSLSNLILKSKSNGIMFERDFILKMM